MRRPSSLCLALLCACKAQVAGVPGGGDDVVDAADAALSDAAPVPGDGPIALGKWRTPTKIPIASSTAVEDDVTLSSDTLELFFAINGTNGKDLYYATRPTTADPWTPAAPVSFNSLQSDETPRLSADDKTLYFATGRAGNGALDIYKTTRPAAGSTAWSLPAPVAVNTTAAIEKWFMPCGVNRYVMVKDAGTDAELVEGTLGGAAATPITELNSTGNETGTFLSADCLTIYFASTRVTPTRMYRSQRATVSAKWDPPTPIDDFPIVGGDGNQEDPWISPDRRTFAFASDAVGAGNKDLYLSTR